MNGAKFILSRKKLLSQVKILHNLEFKILYSYKTNHEVGKILQELEKEKKIKEMGFSIHAPEEIADIEDKKKIWFFLQAESCEEIKEFFRIGIINFVIDNEADLNNLLKSAESERAKINLLIRMRFREHRIGTGKYFVYGLPSKKVNKIILGLKDNNNIEKVGIHIHRKSQNTSEWEIKSELEDSISDEVLEKIDFVNFGGGLPIEYKSYSASTMNYIFSKLHEAKEFLEEHNVISYIEPGRFLAGPSVRLAVKIIQVQENNIVVNATIYQCALDTVITGTKMLVEGELQKYAEGKDYLIKGNSPTRDDIFRYKVRLKNPKVGEEIIFLNAGAYNYSTDFFGYHKLKTEIVEDF